MKNKYPRLLMVLCALMIGLGSLWAERVTQEDAALVAANFLNAGNTTSQGAQAPGRNRPMRRVALADDAQYYVYANADGEGWVMVAANDVVKPILAYSKTGTFSADKMPSNVSHWLGHYDKFIKKLEDEGVTQTEEAAAQWKKLRKAPPSTAKGSVVVDALVQTQWDQGAPYNNLCPGSGSNKSYTGCVATAMAQVMNYWQWPVTGNGSRTYQPVQHVYDDNGNLKETITLYGEQTADFANTTYDWANMKKKHYSNDTQAQKTAISTLMYHCGVATDMMYGTDAYGGSGTYTVNYGDWDWSDSEGDCAQNALYNFFRYKKPTGYMRDGYKSGYTTYYKSWTDAEWTAMIKAELDAKRPIMYAGAGSGGGHSFICDGYDDQNYFHFNWGWSGSNDGWYTLSNLVPGSGGAGGGSYSFSEDQDVIIGIEPVQTGHNVVLNGTGCTLSANKQRVENSQSLTVTITPTDATYDYTSTTVKLGGSTISSSKYSLTNNNKTLTIDGSAITGDVSNDLTITVVWTKNRYKYELLGENCTEELSGTLAKNASLSLTITPNTGYTLADAACWDVEMGGNKLTYGTGFTYNANTGAFYIASVTGDVAIFAFGWHPVTWYADGNAVHATNVAVDDKITLPATDPADCASGKVFVGWCTESNYSNATTAPTFAKTGDTYSVANYYAVYATDASGSAPRRATMAESAVASVTFKTAGSDGSADVSSSIKSSLVQAESGISSYSGSKVYAGTAGAKIGSSSAIGYITITLSSAATVKSVVVNAKKFGSDTGTLSVTAGSSTAIGSAQSPTAGGGDLTFTAETAVENVTTIKVATSSKRAYISSITVYEETSGGSGGGGSYTDYSTACGTPCSNTPEMSFTDATVNKTTDDETYTQAVNISGKGSGQTVAYSSSNENIATVNTSGVVTLKGVVGSTTITASVTTDGDYCAASASYTLTVTAAPINVTLYYNGTSKTLENQTNPCILPTTGDYVAAMCSGDWTFAGWYGSEYAKSTTAPTYITQLNATGHAYAVYTTTETVSSAPARAKAAASSTESVTFSDLYSADTEVEGETINIGTHTSVTFTKRNGGTNSKYYSSGSAIRWYGGGSCVVATDEGNITSITFTFGSGDGSNTISADGYTEPTWTGSASSVTFTQSGTSGQRRIAGISVTIEGSGGGGSSSVTYYATTPECVTPCSNTPEMSFTDATVNKTTADANFTQAVNISGKGDGQTVAYSSSDASVATVDNSGVVTLLGKVGLTTITASVEANGDYCAASASYTLNVSAAPISVTLHYYDNQVTTLNNQQSPYTLPTTGSYVADACDGDWTFAGWYGSEYAKSTTAPTYITQLTATGSAYAVYTTTETVSSAPIRKTAATVGTTLWAEDFSGYSANDVPSGATANSHTGTTVYDNGSVTYSVTNGKGTTKVYNESNTSGEAPELLIAKGNGTLSISGIPTGDATAMTLTFGTNKTSSISVSSGTTGISVGSVTISSGTATCEITNTGNIETFDLTITNSNSSNSREDDFLLVVKTAGSSGGGGGGSSSVTYYATTPECVTGCTITPTMSFANEAVTQTTDDAGYVQYVTIENKGDGQTVAYSSSDETVATVSNLGGVTLKGVVGSTTITASVEASGTYCAASASYTITVEPCALTSITLNTTSAKKTFFVGEQFTHDNVVVTANYSNCDSKTVNGFYTVPDMSSADTKTVNVSYTENGVTQYASYEITVEEAVTYTVTWKACGEVFDSKTYQEGAALVLPTSTPGGNAGKSFVGWTATAHYTGASAPPDLFSTAGSKTVTGNVTYYAVYE